MRDAEGAQDMNGACRQGDVPSAGPIGSKVGTETSLESGEYVERPVCPPLPSVEDAILLASQANSWRIRGLAVDLPLRGRGVGSRLISTLHPACHRQAGLLRVVRGPLLGRARLREDGLPEGGPGFSPGRHRTSVLHDSGIALALFGT
ncbi:hypothetical protein MRX96_038077 [Rhipicephalus microplus]